MINCLYPFPDKWDKIILQDGWMHGIKWMVPPADPANGNWNFHGHCLRHNEELDAGNPGSFLDPTTSSRGSKEHSGGVLKKVTPGNSLTKSQGLENHQSKNPSLEEDFGVDDLALEVSEEWRDILISGLNKRNARIKGNGGRNVRSERVPKFDELPVEKSKSKANNQGLVSSKPLKGRNQKGKRKARASQRKASKSQERVTCDISPYDRFRRDTYGQEYADRFLLTEAFLDASAALGTAIDYENY